MKFTIKVGTSFDVIEATVEDDLKSSFSKTKAVTYISIALAALCVISATILGVVTGDYSLLRDFAESGKSIFTILPKLLGH